MTPIWGFHQWGYVSHKGMSAHFFWETLPTPLKYGRPALLLKTLLGRFLNLKVITIIFRSIIQYKEFLSSWQNNSFIPIEIWQHIVAAVLSYPFVDLFLVRGG